MLGVESHLGSLGESSCHLSTNSCNNLDYLDRNDRAFDNLIMGLS